MREIILVKYGEIFLKGQNRPLFLRALIRNIKCAVKDLSCEVWLHDSRIFVSGYENREQCIDRVSRIFGVAGVCPAVEMPADNFDSICSIAVSMMEGITGTFKVETRRSDKRYPLDSPAISAAVGSKILEAYPHLHVDVHQPEHLMRIEIRDKAYLYVRVYAGVGGMPVGTNGNALLLLSGGFDSPVAGWMIAKRGVKICAVHFASPPYTSQMAREKVINIARCLSYSCCGLRLFIVPFTDIQMSIHEKCPPGYTTLIIRRMMMRIAERIAENENCSALVTGESIGQVASQTMDALSVTDSVVSMPVFRPLIGFDKNEIITLAEKIGTAEISVQPYEDCCTVFTPRHPSTHPKVERAVEAECRIDYSDMIEKAVNNAECVSVPYKDNL